MRQKTWLVTGATRGLGVEIVSAALDAGDRVVATDRDPDMIARTFGQGPERLLVVRMDVTDQASIREAIDATSARFGGLDVLVNNAGYCQFGMFDELTAEDFARQFATNVFGLIDVTRAVLPIMRRQRSGKIFNISSIAGIRGAAGSSAYSASKFAVEGFSESLAEEVAPFGIAVTIVQPGFFRTSSCTRQSARYRNKVVDDYAQASEGMEALYDQWSGNQAGDPRKLAAAIVTLVASDSPPVHFPAGTDAVEAVVSTIEGARDELDKWWHISVGIDEQTKAI